MLTFGMIYMIASVFRLSLNLVIICLTFAPILAQSKHQLYQQNIKNAHQWQSKNLDSALVYAQQAQEIANQLSSSTFQIEALNELGAIHISLSNYDSARFQLQKALRQAQSIHNLYQEALSLQLLSKLYWYLEDYDLSLSYAAESLSILPQKNQSNLRMTIYNQLGNALSSKGNPDSAQVYYMKIIPLALKNESHELLASSYMNLAVLYDQKKDFDESLFYYEQALKTFRYGNIPLGEFYSLVNIAGIYEQKQQASKALSFLYQARPIIDTLQLLSEEVWLMEQFYKAYQLTSEKDSILKYALTYHELKDSLFNKEKLEKLNELENQFIHEQKLAKLQEETALAQSQRSMWITASLSLTLILLALVYILYMRAQKKHLQSLIIQQENKRIQEINEVAIHKNEQLHQSLNHQKTGLSVATLQLMEKNEWLQQLKKDLENLHQEKNPQLNADQLNKIIKQINSHIHDEDSWNQVKQQFESIHPQFFDRLLAINPDLSPKDLRISAYLRMNLSTKDIAQLMNYSPRGIESMRYRLRKKLAIASHQDLNIWMIQL